jgi:hypothetical protein
MTEEDKKISPSPHLDIEKYFNDIKNINIKLEFTETETENENILIIEIVNKKNKSIKVTSYFYKIYDKQYYFKLIQNKVSQIIERIRQEL